MTAPVFVDTNVLVYARDKAFPQMQDVAAIWLEQLWRERTGRVSVQVLAEYYVTVTRKLRPARPSDEAWEDVRGFMAWNPQPLDAAVLERGRDVERRYRLSWWDSLIVAAALLQGCGILLSEDLQDGMDFGGVTVHNPFTLKAGEKPGTYTVAPVPVRRHPPRGRPRKR